MRRFVVAVLLCGAVLSGGAVQARSVRRQPEKMLHLGTIVVPRRHPQRAAFAKWVAKKALRAAVTVALSL